MGCGASNTQSVDNQSRPAAPRNNAAPAAMVSRSLIATKSYVHGAPITLSEITKQRVEFWNTRTDGNAHMWQAIRSSAEALLTNDVSLANVIIEASNISTPNGSLEVCYDERGHQYKVPQYCVSNPVELTETAVTNTNTSISCVGGGGVGGGVPSFTVSAQVIPTNENKSGKTVSAKSTYNAPITVRIRINPGDHNLTVKSDVTQSVLELKHSIMIEADTMSLPSMEIERQRVIFMGKELRNHQRVGDIGFEESKVVQVFMRPALAAAVVRN